MLYIFTRILFNGFVNNSVYIISNDSKSETMNSKGCGRKQTWPNFKVLSVHWPGKPEENQKKSKDSQCLGQYSKLGTS